MGEMLRCRAENPVMPASQIEDTWSLDINCESVERILACMVAFKRLRETRTRDHP